MSPQSWRRTGNGLLLSWHGGRGGVALRGLSHVNFRSEDYTANDFRSSGAHYDLKLVPAPVTS
jgi:hypothetical protein